MHELENRVNMFVALFAAVTVGLVKLQRIQVIGQQVCDIKCEGRGSAVYLEIVKNNKLS